MSISFNALSRLGCKYFFLQMPHLSPYSGQTLYQLISALERIQTIELSYHDKLIDADHSFSIVNSEETYKDNDE